MSEINERRRIARKSGKRTGESTTGAFAGRRDDPRKVLSWYDFLCPFCYVGKQRIAILVRHGLHVVELPFQAHPYMPGEELTEVVDENLQRQNFGATID
jgi:DSBA-like thioredoxin domain